MNKFLTSLLFGLILLGVAAAALAYMRLPFVQVNSDGECVRVIDLDANGNEISQPCSTVDLENDRYHREVVL